MKDKSLGMLGNSLAAILGGGGFCTPESMGFLFQKFDGSTTDCYIAGTGRSRWGGV